MLIRSSRAYVFLITESTKSGVIRKIKLFEFAGLLHDYRDEQIELATNIATLGDN
jgi:hypothetical protein